MFHDFEGEVTLSLCIEVFYVHVDKSLNLRCVLPRNTLFESTKSVLNVTAISNWSQIIMYRVRTISVTKQNKLSAKMVL